jgi:hypothetical protein
VTLLPPHNGEQGTERTGVEEVLASHLGWYTGYSEFPLLTPGKYWGNTSIELGPLPFQSFLIH